MTSASSSKKRSSRLLSSTRPKYAGKEPSTLSSKATRTLIRSHHTLHKRLAQAEKAGDATSVAAIQAQIEHQGGLARYQQASIQGQSVQRGGDSSKVLVEWLRELCPSLGRSVNSTRLRYLEVGALRTDNVCSTCGLFDVVRIDLNSQGDGILQQDFMARPLPTNATALAANGFDLVSLSLVVNYVPDPVARGEMLKRVASFLRPAPGSLAGAMNCFPGLFLVLPSPCVINSRYLDNQRLEDMLYSLGYTMQKKKVTAKLVYYYFIHSRSSANVLKQFPKKEIRSGGKRNNFAIVL